jgi:hypothetical protein
VYRFDQPVRSADTKATGALCEVVLELSGIRFRRCLNVFDSRGHCCQ